ncbi:hypothetical protein Dda_1065 [Drechslerella dactyloides]|uniref:Uncharacterized protein n=1 Tax=Drechslerella dactyloides TaxID=74499 RepID=A0AAD6J8I4_DREDA|nr:hypothetical protein Dda_1065 [Drechslerella dactyloides]
MTIGRANLLKSSDLEWDFLAMTAPYVMYPRGLNHTCTLADSTSFGNLWQTLVAAGSTVDANRPL